MSRDQNELIITCGPRGHWLVRAGPDPEVGGRVTVRWHTKQNRRGYQTERGPWPIPDQEIDSAEVGVVCRCWRGTVWLHPLSRAWDAGLRGRYTLPQLIGAGVFTPPYPDN